jgi:hypothetical protein
MAGGSSLMGSGGDSKNQALTTAVPGDDGKNYGCGGGGVSGTDNAAATGGTGAPGIVIVEEFY